MAFSTLGLSPDLLAQLLPALERQGYRQPTAIQAQAVPAIVQGRDVIAAAPTGSGKTAAFVLPLLQQFALRPASRPRRVRALVLVPTRELATQVEAALATLGDGLPSRPKRVVAIGGVSINPQMMALRGGADIVVATPGRLLDLVARHALELSAVATLVLDEADRLLDLGFGEELQRLLALLPQERQTVLFSATFPPAVRQLAATMLHEPVRIGGDEEEGAQAPDIAQRAILVDAAQRTPLLRQLLDGQDWPQALVFVASRHAAETVAQKLRKAGIEAQPLHGELGQGRRSRTLQEFRDGALRVLVATDVAARGIDIPRLPVVVNYDLPRSPVDYTHRIGRTGRAGEPGLAVSFIDAAAEAHFRLIEKRRRQRVPREQVPGFEPRALPPASPAASTDNGGVKGRRPSRKDRLRAAAQASGEPAAD
ncbi:DEAD/DEAH box helicase [Flavobacterium sp. MXW15]|uniref:DEAD/DEAH box helicase n=1 Tax=Xanthomonas chitinilytica TaxID=2989819 RepID=A0ABT3JTF3_9XANT|nr:DEAD/DEAH box helicase [Xanthomonas sp. H13-6]MCW4454518.1 DEAD/DEAH box helicase [Flavobacterium sp. MXW15]MCW4471757.1 DEAD/DEAH box helicase [Xanthomonas sp. H13-6]